MTSSTRTKVNFAIPLLLSSCTHAHLHLKEDYLRASSNDPNVEVTITKVELGDFITVEGVISVNGPQDNVWIHFYPDKGYGLNVHEVYLCPSSRTMAIHAGHMPQEYYPQKHFSHHTWSIPKGIRVQGKDTFKLTMSHWFYNTLTGARQYLRNGETYEVILWVNYHTKPLNLALIPDGYLHAKDIMDDWLVEVSSTPFEVIVPAGTYLE